MLKVWMRKLGIAVGVIAPPYRLLNRSKNEAMKELLRRSK